jgi:hypothetical protein
MNGSPKHSADGSLSTLRRIRFFILLILFMIGGIAVGLFLSGGPKPIPQPALFSYVVAYIAAAGFLVIGLTAYLVCIVTSGLTFNFTKPVYRGYAHRRRIMNLIVPLLFYAAFAAICAPPIASALLRWFAPTAIGIIAFFAPFMIAQFIGIWIDLWSPMDVMFIRRRLHAIGIKQDQLSNAWLIGLSNATVKKSGVGGLVEDDFGALWVAPLALIYCGDQHNFSISREDLVQVEQKAHPRSSASMFGVRHVLLHFNDAEGAENHIYLHIEGAWNMSRYRVRCDRLAEAIVSWSKSPPPVPNPAAHFAVQPSMNTSST